MRWPWQRRRQQREANGRAARAAREEARRRLEEAQRRQDAVERAHDRLAAWVDQALRGGHT